MSKNNNTTGAKTTNTRRKGAPSDAPIALTNETREALVNVAAQTARENVVIALAALNAASNDGAALAQRLSDDAGGATTNGAPDLQARPDEKGAPTLNYVLSAPGAGADALGGRIGARTNVIHVVLCEAAQNDEIITSKNVGARANVIASAKGAPPVLAHESHLNTMNKRNLIERVNGAWRLTNKARELVKLAPNKS